MAVFTKTDWSNTTWVTSCLGISTQMLERFLDAVNDGDGIGVAALLQNREVNGRLTVHTHDVGLNGVGVHGVADIPDEHGGLADRFQGHAVDELGGRCLAVGIQIVIDGSDFDVAGGKNEIALVDGANHVHGAQLVGFKLQWIDIHHDLAILSAEGLGNRSAWDVGNLVANVVLTEVVQFGFVQTLAFEGNQADGQAGGVKLQHHRRQRAGRKAAEVGHREIRNRADDQHPRSCRVESKF